MVGIVDPPRAEAKAAIAKCHSAGIQVRMITGDHAVTAAAIGARAGHRGRGAHRRRVRRDERRRARRPPARDRRRRPRGARGQDPPGPVAAAAGQHRGDDRRRRQRRAGAEEGRHRRGHGHHRHRGLQGGRGDDPDRRQLRHHRQGGRVRPRALRQPVEVHPLPDDGAGRLHRQLPRRGDLLDRRRRPVLAAGGAVDQLPGPGAHRHRAGLRQADCRA